MIVAEDYQDGRSLGTEAWATLAEFGDKDYFWNPEYDGQTHTKKMEDLWKMITADSTPKEQAFEDLDLLWSDSIRSSFYRHSDELQKDDRKRIH
jgi:hypothetical protein